MTPGKQALCFLVLCATFYIAVELTAINFAYSQELQSQPAPGEPIGEQPRANSDSSLLGVFVTMLGLMVVFSFVLYFALKVYKQTVVDKRFGSLGSEIKVLGTSAIGPKKSLCVVNAFQHILLLGMTDSQINVLLDIPFENLNDEMRKALSNPEKKQKSVLEKFLIAS